MKFSVIPFLLLLTAYVHAASFDCSKGSSPVEQEICNNPKLGDLDLQLTELYRNMLASLDAETKIYLKKKQIEWLKERNACPVEPKPYYTLEGCVSQRYERRIKQLVEQSKRLQQEKEGKDYLSKTPKITTELGRIISDVMWEEILEIPNVYYPFKDNLVLVEMDGARAIQGIYAVDIAKRKAQIILPGLVEVIKRAHDWWLIRSDGMNRNAGMWSTYTVLNTSNDSHLIGGIKMTEVISVTQDGESGFCGSQALSKKFGWKTTQNIDSFELEESEQHQNILTFHIIEQDCQTMEKKNRVLKYSITNGVLDNSKQADFYR